MSRSEAAAEWRWLKWLAAIRIVEGVALWMVAVELIELVDQRLDVMLEQWVTRLHVDPSNPAITTALGYARGVEPAALDEFARVSGALGGLNFLQGIGLWLRRAWGEYVCVLSTALFIPLEIQELTTAPHLAAAGMLLVNATVVGLLVYRIVRKRWPRRDA